MNLEVFEKLYGRTPLCQNKLEWRAYLEFISAYFWNRNIRKPLIVEIGIERGGQQIYYETFLDAQYVGIDISDKYCIPSILADAFDTGTVKILNEMTAGRDINLIYIDIDSRETARKAYGLYASLAKNIIAVHSIFVKDSMAAAFWRELQDARDSHTKIGIRSLLPEGHPNYITPMGIGLVVKE